MLDRRRLIVASLSMLPAAASSQTVQDPAANQFQLPPGFGIPPGQTPPPPQPPGGGLQSPGGTQPGGTQPQGPATNNQDYDEAHKRFMLGEWAAETASPVTANAMIKTQVRYFPDMTFRGFQQTIASFGGPSPYIATQPLNGKWAIQGINERRFLLTLASPSGVGTSVLDILDQNRLRNNDQGYTAVRVAY